MVAAKRREKNAEDRGKRKRDEVKKEKRICNSKNMCVSVAMLCSAYYLSLLASLFVQNVTQTEINFFPCKEKNTKLTNMKHKSTTQYAMP
jgi:flagellar biosynthesis protein FlhB